MTQPTNLAGSAPVALRKLRGMARQIAEWRAIPPAHNAIDTRPKICVSMFSDAGTEFHTLQTDARFRVGVKVICITSESTPTGIRKTTGLRLFDTADASGKQETEIARLKDKAMQNMSLTRGELHALLASFPDESPQAYALAIQLKRQHRDKTVAIAEKVCRCTLCKSVFELESPRYTFAWGKTRCPKCNDNVNFDRVDPLPSEPADSEELDWQEMQRRLKSRFGGGNSG